MPTITTLPTHLDLPDTNGEIVENGAEQYQNAVLTSSIEPLLAALHPDGQYFIGQDVGIYYRITDPPLDGCKAPDWYYIPNVSPMSPDGIMRHSYVMWHEPTRPYLLVEQVSRTPRDELDRTPESGKFWVYENVLKVPYYVISDGYRETLECYQLVNGVYTQLTPNRAGRFTIPRLNVQLGLWHGVAHNVDWCWLRFFDKKGKLIPTAEERAEHATTLANQEKQRAEQEKQRAEQEKQRADDERTAREAAEAELAQLREQLKKLGGPQNP